LGAEIKRDNFHDCLQHAERYSVCQSDKKQGNLPEKFLIPICISSRSGLGFK